MMVLIVGLLLQFVVGLGTSTFEQTNKPVLKEPEWDRTIIKEI